MEVKSQGILNRRSAAIFGRFDLGAYFEGFGWARSWQADREKALEHYNDLIENADDHILADLGVTRADLFRMRAALYDTK